MKALLRATSGPRSAHLTIVSFPSSVLPLEASRPTDADVDSKPSLGSSSKCLKTLESRASLSWASWPPKTITRRSLFAIWPSLLKACAAFTCLLENAMKWFGPERAEMSSSSALAFRSSKTMISFTFLADAAFTRAPTSFGLYTSREAWDHSK